MLMCSRCKKRPAVVFISQMNAKNPQHKKNEGLCLVCAKELGISQVDDYMKAMGISDDDLEAMSNQLMEASDGDDFEPGGTNFLSNLFGGDAANLFSNLAGGMPKATDEGGENKPKDKKKKLKFLNNYCTNLTQKAREGKLDNVVGRDKEISRVIHILSRRQKNNPCLIGEPGVGKPAIAEGIAQRIVGGDVPFHIKDKELYLLDLTALVAGTQFRGQFESRCKGLVEEVKEQGNVILFIDEVHTLVGTGDNEGTMNAANILKPSLSRGEIQVIGATTFKEYRKYIEKDSALERRFQPVTVSEPTVEDTITVLKGIKQYYENFHRVKISDDMLRECAVLSERYINDRFLPDKAIDLLDEACACTSIRTPEIEEFDALNEELKKHEKLVEDYEQKSDPDYEIIAKEKGEILRIQNRLKEVEETLKNVQVTEEDISKVIELWTGIPANKIAQTEYDKIKHLKEALSKRVIGQDEAVERVSEAIMRSRAGIANPNQPIGSFLFLGPTGVGKTELAKTLAEALFDDEKNLVRIDMSEYMEKFSVSRLIGAPPGYVGYEEGGQLTEAVRRRPYSVILFDEIEKAHPDVFNILLQILEDGRLTDNTGRTVSFKNTIIVMTSNAGAHDIGEGRAMGFGSKALADATNYNAMKDAVMKAVKDVFRPEFINRVDELIVFHPLTEVEIRAIAGMMLGQVASRLKERAIALTWDDEVVEKLAREGYDVKFGARPLRRLIQRTVEDTLSEELLGGKIALGDRVRLKVTDGKITVEKEA